MVQVTINFLRFTVAFQQSTQDSHAADPKELLGHTGIGSTLSFTKPTVSSLTTSFSILANTGSGVDSHWLFDNETILDKFTDVLP